MCPVTDRRRTCRGPVQRPLIKMADSSVSACMEQRVVMKQMVHAYVLLVTKPDEKKPIRMSRNVRKVGKVTQTVILWHKYLVIFHIILEYFQRSLNKSALFFAWDNLSW